MAIFGEAAITMERRVDSPTMMKMVKKMRMRRACMVMGLAVEVRRSGCFLSVVRCDQNVQVGGPEA